VQTIGRCLKVKEGRKGVKDLGFKFFLLCSFKLIAITPQWKRISHKQSARWQHLSQLKASAFFCLQKKYLLRNTATYTWD
jgi:hypothetical protein